MEPSADERTSPRKPERKNYKEMEQPDLPPREATGYDEDYRPYHAMRKNRNIRMTQPDGDVPKRGINVSTPGPVLEPVVSITPIPQIQPINKATIGHASTPARISSLYAGPLNLTYMHTAEKPSFGVRNDVNIDQNRPSCSNFKLNQHTLKRKTEASLNEDRIPIVSRPSILQTQTTDVQHSDHVHESKKLRGCIDADKSHEEVDNRICLDDDISYPNLKTNIKQIQLEKTASASIAQPNITSAMGGTSYCIQTTSTTSTTTTIRVVEVSLPSIGTADAKAGQNPIQLTSRKVNIGGKIMILKPIKAQPGSKESRIYTQRGRIAGNVKNISTLTASQSPRTHSVTISGQLASGNVVEPASGITSSVPTEPAESRIELKDSSEQPTRAPNSSTLRESSNVQDNNITSSSDDSFEHLEVENPEEEIIKLKAKIKLTQLKRKLEARLIKYEARLEILELRRKKNNS